MAAVTAIEEAMATQTGISFALSDEQQDFVRSVRDDGSMLAAALEDRAPAGRWWMSAFGAGFNCHGALLEVA